jgi:hypothetical protein
VAFFLVVVAVSAVVGVLSWRRSGGSMTRYLPFTGAPLVWLLLGASALSAVAAAQAGDDELARDLFTGGVIGTALVQVVLLRRGLGSRAAEEEPQEEVR